MAVTTTLTLTLDGNNDRNALVEVRGRIEGALTDNNVVNLGRTATTITVDFEDTVPAEQVNACVRTLANLAGRPGSGISRGMTFSNSYDSTVDSLQREYSR